MLFSCDLFGRLDSLAPIWKDLEMERRRSLFCNPCRSFAWQNFAIFVL